MCLQTECIQQLIFLNQVSSVILHNLLGLKLSTCLLFFVLLSMVNCDSYCQSSLIFTCNNYFHSLCVSLRMKLKKFAVERIITLILRTASFALLMANRSCRTELSFLLVLSCYEVNSCIVPLDSGGETG